MPWAPDYVTPEVLGEYCRADVSVDGNDYADLVLAASGASRAVDRHTGRQFGIVAAPEPRWYTAEYDDEVKRWVVTIDDVMDTAGVLVAADRDGNNTYTDTIDQFVFWPRNNLAIGKPYEQLMVLPSSANQPTAARYGVQVTARPGWTTVPKAVELTTKLQGSRFFMRREAPFGIAGSPENGSEMRLLAKVDPDLTVGLAHYRRRVWSA